MQPFAQVSRRGGRFLKNWAHQREAAARSWTASLATGPGRHPICKFPFPVSVTAAVCSLDGASSLVPGGPPHPVACFRSNLDRRETETVILLRCISGTAHPGRERDGPSLPYGRSGHS